MENYIVMEINKHVACSLDYVLAYFIKKIMFTEHLERKY